MLLCHGGEVFEDDWVEASIPTPAISESRFSYVAAQSRRDSPERTRLANRPQNDKSSPKAAVSRCAHLGEQAITFLRER